MRETEPRGRIDRYKPGARRKKGRRETYVVRKEGRRRGHILQARSSRRGDGGGRAVVITAE